MFARHISGGAKCVPFLQTTKHLALALVFHERNPIEFRVKIVHPENFSMTTVDMWHADIVHVEAAILTRRRSDGSVLVGWHGRAVGNKTVVTWLFGDVPVLRSIGALVPIVEHPMTRMVAAQMQNSRGHCTSATTPLRDNWGV